MQDFQSKIEQEIEKYSHKRLKSFHAFIVLFSQECLIISLIAYLSLLLVDVLADGIISYIFNINLILIIVVVFFFIHSLLSILERQREN